MTGEIINHPRITPGESGGFSLYWKMPSGNRELVKKITPKFREGLKNKTDLTQKSFGLPNSHGSYPRLSWDDERGLIGIVIGDGCQCAMLGSMNNYYFHNVDTSTQALALIEMLSIYLNRLQALRQ